MTTAPIIGKGKVEGALRHGEYVGRDPALRGKKALVSNSGDGVVAQFDDHSTGLGYGWHTFGNHDFKFQMVEANASE